MLFYGPPGTGKTSTILALAKSLFGPALYRSRILELNASDERGIGIVRDKVKNFARAQLSQPTGLDAAYRAQYPCPPFKIIILDEADSMTQDAQSALRRTMEQYSRITRFCLVCNYVTRIIEPLASRCSKFRFKSLDNMAAGVRVQDIARAEGLNLEDGVVETLIRCGEGDLRRAITYLQSAARLVGAARVSAKDADDDAEMTDAGSSGPGIITVRSIEEIAGVVPETILDNLVQAMQPKGSGSAYEDVSRVVTDLVADGWSATQVVGQVCYVAAWVKVTMLILCSCIAELSLMRLFPTFRRTRSLWSFLRWTSGWSTVRMSIYLSWTLCCVLLGFCVVDLSDSIEETQSRLCGQVQAVGVRAARCHIKAFCIYTFICIRMKMNMIPICPTVDVQSPLAISSCILFRRCDYCRSGLWHHSWDDSDTRLVGLR